MTLLGFNGFEHKSVLQRPGSTQTQFNYIAGRFGGSGSLFSGSSTQTFAQTITPVTGPFVIGMAYQSNALNTGRIQLSGGGALHLTLSVNSVTRGWELFRGDTNGTLLAASQVGIFQATVWYYVELKATINDTTGTAIARINGQEIINFTGDTRNAGTAQVDTWTFTHPASGSGQQDWVDDLYYLDTNGAAPYNDFLGDVKVETLVPNGSGFYTQFTPSTGSNWQCVDELPAVTTDYVGSATIGNRDTYAHTDLVTTSATILALQPMATALASDAGGANIKAIARNPSGTIRAGTSSPLSATATLVMGGVQTVDPDNAAWTVASINAAEFGVEVS